MRATTRAPLPFLIVGLALAGSIPTGQALGARLPDPVPADTELELVSSPDGSLTLFYLMAPGQIARFGVASPGGEVLWEKRAGVRPVISHGWSDDSRLVIFVTDCNQKESELPARNPDTRSWFYVLDARTGTVRADGDLDTDVLDLPGRLPDAVGAAHELELGIRNGNIEVLMTHRGTRLAGVRALSELGTADRGP